MVFPFLLLPRELQLMVWDYFCPEMADEPFLLGFIYNSENGYIFEGDALAHTTASARGLLSIDRDTRQLALKAFPDTLAIRDGQGLVRFRKERDLVILVDIRSDWDNNMSCRNVPGFFESVANLLVPWHPYGTLDLYCLLPNLKVLYHLCYPKHYNSNDLAWCFSDSVHHSKSLNIPAGTVYWPDLVRHRNYAEKNIPGDKFPAGAYLTNDHGGSMVIPPDQYSLSDAERKHLDGVRVWPMVARDFMEVWRPKDYLPVTGSPPGRPYVEYDFEHPRWDPCDWW